VNSEIAARLHLEKTRVLQPMSGTHRQLVTYIPEAFFEQVRDTLFAEGAGAVGHYDECGFAISGEGTFRPLPGANPFSGKLMHRETEAEKRLEIIYPVNLENKIIKALKASHPYEEVAYSLYPMENKFSNLGAGIMGELNVPTTVEHFFEKVKAMFNTGVIKYSIANKKDIQRIAICGGSGKSLITSALKNGADLFLTADLRYHDFFSGEGQMIIADMGHFESEQYTSDLIVRLITEKIPTFAVRKAASKTNPVNYFL
jgi:hypothetical protein